MRNSAQPENSLVRTNRNEEVGSSFSSPQRCVPPILIPTAGEVSDPKIVKRRHVPHDNIRQSACRKWLRESCPHTIALAPIRRVVVAPVYVLSIEWHFLISDNPGRKQPATRRVLSNTIGHRLPESSTRCDITDFVDTVE